MDIVDRLITKINTGKFDYQDLEKLANMWQEKVCIRGAGFVGADLAFEILTVAGFHIDYFMDIGKRVGSKIKNTAVISPDNLQEGRILFVVAVGEKYQNEVIAELRRNRLSKYIVASYKWEDQIVRSVKEKGDECANRRYSYWANDRICAERWLKEQVGYEPDLDHPRTFNEKLQWLKLNDRNPRYTQLVDKYAVKEYVAEVIGEKYVIPTLGIWDDPEQIDFDILPNQFVLKCTHDSGSSILCRDKMNFDCVRAKEKLRENLGRNYYYIGREWPYKNVRPQILCEKYIGTYPNEELPDYKIMCFNGQAKCSFVCSERFSDDGLKVTFFDMDWNVMPFERHYPKSKAPIEKPRNYHKMIELAEKLAYGLTFVRVDFYEVEGDLYFGELTFYPGNGLEEFRPTEWDGILGDWLRIPQEIHVRL